jgi:hypothetical protein
VSIVHTYCDPKAGLWRNRLVGREPFPMEYRDVVSAVAAGQQIAQVFGAGHVLVHPSGQQRPVPRVESRDSERSA